MNSKTIVKIMLDFVMTILFVTLIDAYGTGLVYHEIAGLSIFFLFLFHIILNWSWVKYVTKSLFSKKLKASFKLKYLLNFTLVVGITTIVISGIFISQVTFPFLADSDNRLLIAVHKWSSYICLGLFGIHIALHWQYLVCSIRYIFSHFHVNSVRKTILRFGAATLIVGIVYSGMISSLSKDLENEITQNKLSIDESYGDVPSDKEIRSRGKNRFDEKHYSESTEQDSFYERSDSGESDNNSNLEDPQDTGETISINEFLSKMYCTACPKNCLLISPRCGKAEPQIQAAKAEYQQLYKK